MRKRLQIFAWALLGTMAIGAPGEGARPQTGSRYADSATTQPILPGSWRIETEGTPARTLCVSDFFQLVQLSHPGLNCGRLVIEDSPTRKTHHYTCPGAGWGRTTLRIETPRLVQIETQGIADRQPFGFNAEARRISACATGAAGGRRR